MNCLLISENEYRIYKSKFTTEERITRRDTESSNQAGKSISFKKSTNVKHKNDMLKA